MTSQHDGDTEQDDGQLPKKMGMYELRQASINNFVPNLHDMTLKKRMNHIIIYYLHIK